MFYHTFNGEIVVFDLACPYEVNPEIRVDFINIIGEAICKNGILFIMSFIELNPLSKESQRTI